MTQRFGHFPNDGAWHHLALAIGDVTATITLDGMVVARGPASLPRDPEADAYLARPVVDDGSDGARLVGALDEVAFHARELAALFTRDSALTTDHDNLVAEWRFDGDYAESLDPALTATVNGTPAFSDGIDDRAVAFAADGSDVALDNDVFDASLTSFGLSLWVKNETPLVGNNALLYLMGNDSQNGGGIGLHLTDHADGVRLVFKMENSGGGLNLVTPFGGFPSDDAWHHVAITSDGSEGGLYIDGELVASAPTQTIDAATKPLRIGSNANGTQHSFIGRLDELRLYDGPIGPAEIAARHAAGREAETHATGTVTHWAFDGDFTDSGETETDLLPTSAYRFVDGVIGKAIVLDGVDDALTASRVTQTTSDLREFTFETWLRVTAPLDQAPLTTYALAGNRDGTDGGFTLTLTADATDAGKLTYTTWRDGVSASMTTNVRHFPTDGAWHHLILVQDSDRAQLFLDGLRLREAAIAAPGTSTVPMVLGHDPAAAPLPAHLDETRFQARVLSAEAIREAYLTSAPAPHRNNDIIGDSVAYWGFDGTPTDAQHPNGAVGSNGKLEGIAEVHGASYVPGRFGVALDHTAGYVTLGDHPDYDISGDFTLSLWARYQAPLGSGSFIDLIDTDDLGGITLTLEPITATLIARTRFASGVGSVGAPAGTWPDDGDWHHVVVVLEGDVLRIVFDGEVVNQQAGVFPPDGSANLPTTNTFNGALDQIVLMDRAMSDWEILTSYRADLTPITTKGEPAAKVVATIPLPLFLLERSDTDPFGLQRREAYVTGVPGIDIEEHLYTGQEKEAELGLYYYGARYYFPEVGRFLQVDPMREFWNPFSYVGNNPIMMIDPTGEEELPPGAEKIETPPLEQVAQFFESVASAYNYYSSLVGDDAPEEVDTILRFLRSQMDMARWHLEFGEKGINSGINFYQVKPVSNYHLILAMIPYGLPAGLLAKGFLDVETTPEDWEYAIAYLATAGQNRFSPRFNDGPDGSVWQLDARRRGTEIEQRLAATEYDDWYNIGASHGGTFPLVDFQRGNTLVSLKTVDTTGKTWMARMRAHIRDLGRRGSTCKW